MMPFRCLGLQKNVLRPFKFSESFVRTKFPLTSDPGCPYVAPSPLHFFAFSPSSTSRRIKSVCDASQSFSMESSVCLPCDVPQKWFGLGLGNSVDAVRTQDERPEFFVLLRGPR